jgi:hypothetical protein
VAAQTKQPSKKINTNPLQKKNSSVQRKLAPTISNNSLKISSKKINLTGIWRGYFVQKSFNPIKGKYEDETYRYEVQIDNLTSNALAGVTYSYQDTKFYGKASLQGIFTQKTKTILIKELKMLEIKISEFSDPCLMTCYLDYSTNSKKQILRGEYTSLNIKSKKDCGEGTVYLEKVPESDFVKEDFLVKKKPITKPVTSPVSKKPEPPMVKKPTETSKTTASFLKPKFKPGAEDALIKPETKATDKNTAAKTVNSKSDVLEKHDVNEKSALKQEEAKSLPKDIKDRTNNLIKTLYVDEGELLVELYDNGQIDNDTVSIYHNGKPVILKGRLSGSPITVKIKVSAEDPIHELVMVADNLGEIPPNTSLMVVTAGRKTYQLFLTSDLQRNAKIAFEYKPQGDNSKNKK